MKILEMQRYKHNKKEQKQINAFTPKVSNPIDQI